MSLNSLSKFYTFLKGLFQSIYFVEHFIIIHRLTKIMKLFKRNIKWVLKCKSHHLKIFCFKEIKLDFFFPGENSIYKHDFLW